MLARPSGLKLGKEAQAKFEEAKTAPDFQGFLDKKGAKRKNWNNRWFVLKDNYLFYCKTTKAPPQGIINLHGCTVTQIEGPTARPYSFSLLAPKSVSVDAKWTNRTYFFAATSTSEMDDWIKTLQDAGRKSVERAQQKAAAATSDPKAKEKGSDSEEDAPTNNTSDEEKKEKKEKKKKKKMQDAIASDQKEADQDTPADQSTEDSQDKKEKKKKKKKKKETENQQDQSPTANRQQENTENQDKKEDQE